MAMRLRSAVFRAERETSWRELERLLRSVEEGGLRALTPSDLVRLPTLYRGTLSALSVARATSLDRNVVEYLEALAARAYLVVHGNHRHLREALTTFFFERFPTAVRAHRCELALAWALMLAGAVAAFALTRTDPERFYAFVSAAYAQGRGPTSSTTSLRDVLYTRDDLARGLKTFAMFLFDHNTRIGITAFAIGVAGGVPTALLLLSNGLVLGAFAALYQGRALGPDFWGWLLPHGVTELTAVALCGAAGFALGQALLFPGQQERWSALARRGREAGVMVLGAVVMFGLAALIEGIFRQRVHALSLRYAVGVSSAAAWVFYFGFLGRSRP